jgi:hypothetical protein
LLFALVHPDVEVHSFADDADDTALLAACEPMPQNLHVHTAESDSPALPLGEAKNSCTYDLTTLLK